MSHENVKEVHGTKFTRIFGEACTFTWTVENFSLCSLKHDEYLTSPSFTTGESSYPKWCLRLYPNRKINDQSITTIGVFLKRSAEPSSSDFVAVEISIIGSDKTKVYSQGFGNNFGSSKPDFGWHYCIDRQVVLERERSALLPNDTLTLMCEMKVTVGVITSEGSEELIADDSMSSVLKDPDSLIGSLRHLYESEMCSDFVIKIGNEELKVHKNILCARSSVFNSMLNSGMKENLTNCVEITDFDPPVVKTMLRYLYCGQVEDLTLEMCIQLFSIADKYNLQDLKNMCSKYLLRNLNVSNICSVLVLADLHNAQELLTASKRMFCANAAAIQKTEPWTELSETMPHLAISMYQFFVSENTYK